MGRGVVVGSYRGPEARTNGDVLHGPPFHRLAGGVEPLYCRKVRRRNVLPGRASLTESAPTSAARGNGGRRIVGVAVNPTESRREVGVTLEAVAPATKDPSNITSTPPRLTQIGGVVITGSTSCPDKTR